MQVNRDLFFRKNFIYFDRKKKAMELSAISRRERANRVPTPGSHSTENISLLNQSYGINLKPPREFLGEDTEESDRTTDSLDGDNLGPLHHLRDFVGDRQ